MQKSWQEKKKRKSKMSPMIDYKSRTPENATHKEECMADIMLNSRR
jgi:hypothetical protein